MHLRGLIIASAGWVLFLSGCASAPTPTTAQATSRTESPAKPAAEQPKDVPLHKGMTAAEVRTLWGAPDEIQPMTAPAGKAEVWVYRRGVVHQTIAANSTETVQRFNPFYNQMVDVIEPVYGTVTQHTEVTTSLLFFDDKLVSWKQKQEQEQSLDR